MSLLATIKSALGLNPKLEPRELKPFRLAPSAKKVVDRLPEGRALHLATVPIAGGYALKSWEGSDDMLPEQPSVRVVMAPEDMVRLKGMTLEHDGERFALRTELNLYASETPNPDGRKYETDRMLAEGRPQAFREGDDGLPPLAARILGIEGVRGVLFREHTLTVEREPEVPWGPIDRAVDAQLREHFLLCGGPLRETGEVAPDGELESEVVRVLEETLLPYVHSHGGNIELVGVRDGVVMVHLEGACGTCPAAQVTLQAGVRKTLMDALPGQVVAVESV